MVDWVDEKGRTALDVAAGDAVLLTVDKLLGAGAQPGQGGDTSAGARLEREGAAAVPRNSSALHRAAAANLPGSVAVIQRLLAAGADPFARDGHG